MPVDDTNRRVPSGRLTRTARLAAVAAQVGTGLVFRDGATSAAKAASQLAYLRGLAAKIGQLAGYVEGFLPPEQKAAYAAALRSLQDAAAASPIEEVRSVVEEDFQKPIEQLFESWEDSPFASASIGQVHRAKYQGCDVAVKVQHPGIAESMEGDLANGAMLESVARAFLGKNFGSRAMFEELAAGFREELDYLAEAAHQEAFRTFHQSNPAILIPEVLPERTSRRVLCSRYVTGMKLEDACLAPEPDRAQWAATLWQFVFGSFLGAGMFNADPHPGNYLFQADGRVAFLDFGCVRKIPADRLESIRRMHAAVLRGDEPGFADAVTRMMQTAPGRAESLSIEFVRACLAPVLHSPFRATVEYAEGLVQQAREFTETVRKLPANEVTPSPPDLVFVNRLHFGFYSVLARLNAEVDYADIERRLAAGASS